MGGSPSKSSPRDLGGHEGYGRSSSFPQQPPQWGGEGYYAQDTQPGYYTAPPSGGGYAAPYPAYQPPPAAAPAPQTARPRLDRRYSRIADDYHTVDQMGDSADWSNEEHVTIVCELFAEQVKCGNRSSTHLNSVGFKNVIEMFKEKTGMQYTRLQFKNKWCKLKADYTCWKTLLKQTGLGWNETKQNIDMPEIWWKKARKDIPGCGKFKSQRLQNEDNLKIMFEDLRNTGDDHYCASSGLLPQENPLINIGEDGSEDDGFSEEDVVPLSKGKEKRVGGPADNDKGKKAKTSGGLWMQDQISKIVSYHERSTNSIESMVARKDDQTIPSIKEVMSIVKECGAAPGTKEFFIASELFTKEAQREMFMTMDDPLQRFDWLTAKHLAKYG